MALTIKPGSSYRLVKDFGVGPGSIPAGADLEVKGIYPPGTAGIGDIDEDAVLVQYDRPDALPQRVAIPKSVFLTLVKAVS